jgi:hypothetical protein
MIHILRFKRLVKSIYRVTSGMTASGEKQAISGAFTGELAYLTFGHFPIVDHLASGVSFPYNKPSRRVPPD